MIAKPSHARAQSWFASLTPVSKLALAFAIVGFLAAIVQGLAWASGLDFHILHARNGGRGVLLALALLCLLGLMAADRRPAADYGLVAGPGWKRLLFGGLALGAAIHAAYCVLVVLLGVYTVQPGEWATSRTVRAILVMPTAFPLAMIQQVIFSGYLLSVIRERHSRFAAVLVSAGLFAALSQMSDPARLLSLETLPRLVGLFLVGTLLGLMRLDSGSILRPAGFLAGCIAIRRLVRKSSLLTVSGAQDELLPWLGRDLDLVQAPVVWLLLALGIVWLAARLSKRRDEPVSRAETDTGFKRVFPFSNVMILAPLDVWLRCLIDARFRIGWQYVPRLVVSLVLSSLNTVLSLPERLLLPVLLRRRRVLDPVFLVGVHRSGTTHLHNLLALDPQFAAPRAYHVFNPAGFVTCSWLVAPLLGVFLPWKRPMDQVRFHIFAPQEEEFALAGSGRFSPYWAMTFPRRWAAYDRYIRPQDWTSSERRTWQRQFLLFLRKLTLWSGKRPLLKNPYSTGRVSLLQALFPQARFVHLARHPYDVYRSNMHIAREGHVVHQLQDPDPGDSYQTRFLDNYRGMEEAFYRDIETMPAGQVAELAFEDLERDPVGEIRKIYQALGLVFSAEFEARLEHYLDSVGDYQKNRFQGLPDEERRAVDAQVGSLMARWGYGRTGRSPSPPIPPTTRQRCGCFPCRVLSVSPSACDNKPVDQLGMKPVSPAGRPSRRP